MKAIHNKDYSVVKTFKAGLFRVSPSYFGSVSQKNRAIFPFRGLRMRKGGRTGVERAKIPDGDASGIHIQ